MTVVASKCMARYLLRVQSGNLMLAKRTAFIIGGSGFVGINLVEALLARRWRVIAFQRGGGQGSYLDRFDVERRAGDVVDAASIVAALPTDCDAVFHVAADMTFWPRHHQRQYLVNTVGTRHVVAACLARRVSRLVFVSSAAAYGLHNKRLTESSPRLGHRSAIGYVRSKALAEDEIESGRRRGLDAVIANPTTIIGRYDTRVWLSVFRQVRRNALPGVAPGRTSFCGARAVADALVAAASHPSPSRSYLLGGPDASFQHVVELIAELTGGRAPRRPTPEALVRAYAWASLAAARVTNREPAMTPEGAEYLIHRNVVCSELARRELGYQPPALADALADYHDWLRAEALLPAAAAARGAR